MTTEITARLGPLEPNALAGLTGSAWLLLCNASECKAMKRRRAWRKRTFLYGTVREKADEQFGPLHNLHSHVHTTFQY